MNKRRVLLYVQHLLGIGHFKRAMTLARALVESGLEVAVVSGGPRVPELSAEGVRLVQLPPASASDLTFKSLVDETGAPVDDAWKSARQRMLLAAYRDIDPDVVALELFPFGRRQMRFELVPLLDVVTASPRRPLVVSSVRDIAAGGQQEPKRQRLTLDLVERYVDRVLVHSDPRWIPFERTFAHSPAMAHKIHYTGFIVERDAARAHGDAGTDEVIVSAGGGAVGVALLATALRARPQTALAARTWRVLTGVNATASDLQAIEALAARTGDGRVIVERARNDFTTLLANCALSISQAGYNTTMEILAAGTRAVMVPFGGGGETEQTLRARLLAERGRVEVIEEPALSTAALAAAVDRAVAGPPPARGLVDLGGAECSARLLKSWIMERSA